MHLQLISSPGIARAAGTSAAAAAVAPPTAAGGGGGGGGGGLRGAAAAASDGHGQGVVSTKRPSQTQVRPSENAQEQRMHDHALSSAANMYVECM
jgi:hypothetical protein